MCGSCGVQEVWSAALEASRPVLIKACPKVPPMAKAAQWRDAVVLALEHRDVAQLQRLAQKASSLVVTKEVLAETGVGCLVRDRTLWALVPPPQKGSSAADLAEAAYRAWKSQLKSCPVDRAAVEIESIPEAATWRPLGGQKTAPFLQSVAALQEFALSNQRDLRPGIAAKTASNLALMGVTRWADPVQVEADTPRLHGWSVPVQTAARNMIVSAHRGNRSEQARLDALEGRDQPSEVHPYKGPQSAEAFAEVMENPTGNEPADPFAPRPRRGPPRAEIQNTAARGPLRPRGPLG